MRGKESKHNTVCSDTFLSYPTEVSEDMYNAMYMKTMKNMCGNVG